MNKSISLNPFIFGILALVAFLGTVQVFKAAGVWSISGKVDAQGERITAAADDPGTIKGWMTLDDITAVYPVTLEEIITQFSLPADTLGSTAVKDLESETFEVTALRDWISARMAGKDEPAATPVETVLPTATPTPAPAATEHVPADRVVSGKTTYGDLVEWGVPQSAIEAVIGENLPPAGVVIKDHITGKGMTFSEIKAALQIEVDKVK